MIKTEKIEKINDSDYIINDIMIKTMKDKIADQPLDYDQFISK